MHPVAVVFAIFTLVRASYLLDDTDSSIIYSGSDWVSVNDSGRFDLAYNLTSTNTGKTNSTMTIPFYGSGIALYAMIIFAGAYTVSIDRGTPTSHYYDGVVACCTVDIPPRSNVTVYSRTSLSIGNHILLLTMLDNQLGSGASYMYFDYAIVNSPNNAKPTISIKGTSSNDHSSTTSAANPPAKPRSRSVIGPAIGGTIGGIIAISIAIFILFCTRRRARRRDITVFDPDPNILVSNTDHIPVVGAANDRPSSVVIYPDANILVSNVERIPVVGAHLPSSKDMTSTSPIPVTEQSSRSHDVPSSPNSHIPHSSYTVPLTSSLPVSTLPSGIHIPSDDEIPSSASDSALAGEEARFLRHLYARNAPADEIAELMQAMRARKGANTTIVGPPAYDLSYP